MLRFVVRGALFGKAYGFHGLRRQHLVDAVDDPYKHAALAHQMKPVPNEVEEVRGVPGYVHIEV